jgi:predicted nucleic acid-binding protein
VTILLDSTVLIDVLGSRRGRLSVLAEAVAAGHKLATSVVNVAEVYAGMKPGEEDTTREFLAGFECLPVTQTIAEQAGILKYTWARRGRTFGVVDMMVAATALEYGLVLATDNRKDFPMPELSFFPLP